jgi:hypothetical protein
MENHGDVIHQMEKIRYIFQHALYISTDQENPSVKDHLENIDPEFRAVAYEGMAMGFAVKDLASGTLQRWREFVRSVDSLYLPHIHVGLGWAAAKQKLSSLMFLDTLEPLMFSRVLDGLGYYEGTFRQMQAVTNKLYPGCIQPKDFDAFDQGLGRSLWYSYKGDVEKIKDIVLGFDEARRPHLWRGIGIASVFVGKCDETSLETLLEAAFKNRYQLGIGAAIVAKARISTGTLTEDVERACRIWCNVSAAKAADIVTVAESSNRMNNNSYCLWISGMETELSTVILNLS